MYANDNSETDSIFLVMEYMPHDLAGLAVMSKNKFTQEQVKHFMFQLLSALKHCHDQGIMHRDIKVCDDGPLLTNL
jgi:cyclin-dependent kinase 12/13